MKQREVWYNHRYVRPFCENWNTYLYKRVFPLLDKDATLLDVGCGSGEFLVSVAKKINKGYGIDTSNALIKQAKQREQISDINNLLFENIDFFDYHPVDKIDVITMIFILHEIAGENRYKLLKKALQIANTVIIADYSTPQPLNLFGAVNWLAEMLTEKDHYSHFKQYHRSRWIEQLYLDSQLNIIEHEDVLFRSYKILKIKEK